jgi:hypothetical protein
VQRLIDFQAAEARPATDRDLAREVRDRQAGVGAARGLTCEQMRE